MDRAVTTSRMPGIRILGRKGREWEILAKPTSLHGCVVAIRRFQKDWAAEGFDMLSVRRGLIEFSDEDIDRLCPELIPARDRFPTSN